MNKAYKNHDCVHSVPIKKLPLPTFRQILKASRAEWRNSTPRFASLPERENKNIKYFTQWEWNPQPVTFTVARPCIATGYIPYYY